TGNTANGNGLFGISVESGGNATVTGNTANGNGLFGISVESGGNATVTGNTANGNGIEEWGAIGILVNSGGDATVTGNTVTENEVGVYIAGFDVKATVNYNNIFSNTVGLQNDSGKEVNAQNNWWGPGGTGGPGEGKVGEENNGVVNNGVGSTTVFPWSKVKF
ncbi:MAG: right-handed parallel beta-helix repeat-containing protein, partial [Thermodesulfobacteriota bacterium]|nr:right-handed parallel beta-helix repeat-containing protein [Thermodesulfobacteriota bacterium]